MKSKRTTSIGSSSTRTSDIDEVDNAHSSDDSESEDESKPVNDTPVTFEYVYGVASPALHYKLPKSAEPAQTTTTIITSQPAGGARKSGKVSKAVPAQSHTTAKKHSNHQQAEPAVASSSDEVASEVVSVNQSLFLKLLNTIREFFYNRKNWSVTEESIIIWCGFMFFAIIVGCILHFLMA